MGVTWISGRTTTTIIICAVAQIQAYSSENQTCYATVSPIFPKELKLAKLHLPLYLAAVMCVTAILGVSLFTLLLLAAKRQRSRWNTETSYDYETVIPGVRTDPELHSSCSTPDCANQPALLHPTANLCTHFTFKHRESTVTLGLGEYVDVEAPGGRISQYQNLDLSQLEEHVYHSLHRNRGLKDEPLGIKDPIHC